MNLPRFIPAITWLRSYSLTWLRGDILAGITLAAYLLPSSLGDASLANLPPEAGLYAGLFSGLVFWLFCNSRYTVITVTSAISLLVGASLGEIAGGDVSRFAALASATAFLVAAIAFVAWLFRAGSITNFISESVMVGFKCGVALYLASTQIPKLLGIHAAHGDFWENSRHLLVHAYETNVYSAVIGATALALLILGRVYLKNIPMALLVVVGGMMISSLAGFEAKGVTLLGEVPRGFPELGLPVLTWMDLNNLLPLAFACFLIGAVETTAIGRMFAGKHGSRLDVNQELLALAASNLASGLGRGFPVSGGLSQSLVNENSGARTPLSGLVAAGIILVVVLFFSHLLSALPQAVLAAVVLVAVSGLFSFSALRHLWLGDRQEFVVAMAAMFGVMGQGLLRGVLIGVVISLVQLLRGVSRPHVAELGRIPGTRRYTDRERHPDNEKIPGVMIFRPESDLFYFNMDFVRDTILAGVRSATPVPEMVVLDLSASPRVDLFSAGMLCQLADELGAMQIKMRVVEARAVVRERLRRQAGESSPLGEVSRFISVADAVEAFQRVSNR